jgi:hypothetical protein
MAVTSRDAKGSSCLPPSVTARKAGRSHGVRRFLLQEAE